MIGRIPLDLLTATAMFDAIGSGWEFLPPFKKMGVLERYYDHTMWPRAKAGCYSDDTQHLLAVAEALLAMDDPYNVSDADAKALFETHLIAAYSRDMRGGSPRMEEAFVAAMEDGSDELERYVKEKTAGSGAAMRASVFGLLENVPNILRLVGIQASITHSGEGIAAAKIAALMAYFGRRGMHPDHIRQAVMDEYVEAALYLAPTNREVKNPRTGMQCVQAALFAVETRESMCDVAQHIMDMGGDTDTVAVIAMGAIWASRYHANDIPYHFFANLEDGPYGRSHLRKVAKDLMEKLNGVTFAPEVHAMRLSLRVGDDLV